MTSKPFKGGLTVGGPTFDRSKLQMRRPTPDSDALASSDEDRDHVPPPRPVANALYPGGRRPSSGWTQDIPMNRKFSLPTVSFALSQPTTPAVDTAASRPLNNTTSAFVWNTNSSFAPAHQASNRLKETVPSPTSAHHPAIPTSDAEEILNLILTRTNTQKKAVRSQSYSGVQSDIDSTPGHLAHNNRNRTSIRHRPSKPSLLGDSSVGLGQLREVDSDEVDSSNGSEQGVALPLNVHDLERQREQQTKASLRQAAVENARHVRNRATSTGSPNSGAARKTSQYVRTPTMPHSDYAIEEHDDVNVDSPRLALTRRFSEHVAVLGRNAEPDMTATSSWAVPNMPNLGLEALSRRHSFAHVGSHTPTSIHRGTLDNTQEEEEEDISPLQDSHSPEQTDHFEVSAYFTGYGPASRAINASAISAAHPDPVVPHAQPTSNPYAVPTAFGRPNRRLFVVAFKCSRADIYFIYDNTGLEVRPGDLVIVEGDRGCDLGQVTHADLSLEDAKKHKNAANEEHLRWLVMFSQYSIAGGSGENPMLGALARAGGFPNNYNRAQLSGMGVQQDQEFKPKMIKRLAQQHEIQSLRDKEGQEAKAKRQAAHKAQEHGFAMEILDAELQADHHKMTFYYFADTYVNFNPLVADLFKQYKIRIWMSAVNPASVVNPNGQTQIQPPSAIGPGAILHTRTTNAPAPVGGFGNNSFRATEQYGANRGRRNMQQPNVFDEGYYPFAQQIPQYPAAQNAYQMSYGLQQMAPTIYGRPSYPAATTSGSPQPYDGSLFPPATYPASPAFNHASSGGSYRGTPGSQGAYMASNVGGTTYYSTASGFGGPYNNAGGYGTSAGYGNSHTATSGAGGSATYDPAYGMSNLSFGN